DRTRAGRAAPDSVFSRCRSSAPASRTQVAERRGGTLICWASMGSERGPLVDFRGSGDYFSLEYQRNAEKLAMHPTRRGRSADRRSFARSDPAIQGGTLADTWVRW